MSNDTGIKILFVEDVPTDAELAVRELRKGGLEFSSLRVETEETFIAALDSFAPDIVISDYMMPVFDGMKALAIVRSRSAILPFIVLTGALNEDTAVTCMKAGADDYVIKEHIARLPFAVREALARRDTRELAERQRILIEDTAARYQAFFDDCNAVMCVVDPETLNILDVNKAACKFYGWSREELIGHPVVGLASIPEDVQRSEIARGMAAPESPFIYKQRTADGRERYVETYNGSITLDGKPLFLSIVHDVTDREEARDRLEDSLREKSVLLREIHHRVKNNMQVIISLMNLCVQNRSECKCEEVLPDVARRIEAMAIIHDQFYSSDDVARIDLAPYLRQLIEEIRVRYAGMVGVPSIVCDCSGAQLSLDTAIPAGLLVSELLENAVKYAYRGNPEPGVIRLEQSVLNESEVRIVVRDEGAGYPEGVDFNNPTTMGLELIKILTEQLRGTVEFKNAPGAFIALRFPLSP